jgi:hypothetical protein
MNKDIRRGKPRPTGFPLTRDRFAGMTKSSKINNGAKRDERAGV